MGSLSSKLDLFRVNFHTKNAMIPMMARPPATDIPTIGPVPIGGSSSSFFSSCVADALAEEDDLVAVLERADVYVTSPSVTVTGPSSSGGLSVESAGVFVGVVVGVVVVVSWSSSAVVDGSVSLSVSEVAVEEEVAGVDEVVGVVDDVVAVVEVTAEVVLAEVVVSSSSV